MSATEIIKELARLSPAELEAIRVKLDELTMGRSGNARPSRIGSPRLVDPSRAKEFEKQVTELPRYAEV